MTTLTLRTGPVAANPTRDREHGEGAAQQVSGPASRKTSRYSVSSTPKANGDGIPLRPTLPEACSPSSSRNHCSVRPAGRGSQITRAGADPGFHI